MCVVSFDHIGAAKWHQQITIDVAILLIVTILIAKVLIIHRLLFFTQTAAALPAFEAQSELGPQRE